MGAASLLRWSGLALLLGVLLIALSFLLGALRFPHQNEYTNGSGYPPL